MTSDLTRLAKNCFKAALFFFFGIVAALAALSIMFWLGVWGSNNPGVLAYKWHFKEVEPGHLVIKPTRGTKVDLWKQPGWEVWKSIRIVLDNGDIFCYDVRGEFDAPTAEYTGVSSNHAVRWVDLNGDGWFDERFDERAKQWEICVSDKWLRAEVDGATAKTAEGSFEFDHRSGKWERTDSSAMK